MSCLLLAFTQFKFKNTIETVVGEDGLHFTSRKETIMENDCVGNTLIDRDMQQFRPK